MKIVFALMGLYSGINTVLFAGIWIRWITTGSGEFTPGFKWVMISVFVCYAVAHLGINVPEAKWSGVFPNSDNKPLFRKIANVCYAFMAGLTVIAAITLHTGIVQSLRPPKDVVEHLMVCLLFVFFSATALLYCLFGLETAFPEWYRRLITFDFARRKRARK